MFEKHEHRVFPGGDPQPHTVALRMYHAGMRDLGIDLRPLSPNIWQGKGPVTGFGYVVKVTAVATPSWQGSSFQFGTKVEAELEDKGIGFLIAGWVICFPIGALILLFLWLDFRKQQEIAMRSLWEAAALPGPWG